MTHAETELDMYGKPAAPHVPRELIRRYDVFDNAEAVRDPHAIVRALREEPPLIYNLCNPMKGQSWIPTRAADIRAVAGNASLFSAEEQLGFGLMLGEDWKLGPLEMDPPEHTKYRKVMNPWLAPPAVANLSAAVRARCVGLIDAIVGQGRCEFMSEFGFPYPISIFMEMMGLPQEHTADFLRWNGQLLHTGDVAVKSQGARAIVKYLRTLIEERRRAPRDDLVSRAIAARIDDKPMGDTELLGVCYLLFAGGLDTVASSLGFYFRHLAEKPDLQERMRNSPADIPKMVEEFLRVFTPTQSLRRAKADTEIAGVQVRQGDWVHLIYSLANLDSHEFDRPDEIDFERQNARHMAFSFGPHFCMGSHLARRELQIALEEWSRRVPVFRRVANEPAKTHGGLVFGVDRLVLEW
jgi:cytochrome P450